MTTMTILGRGNAPPRTPLVISPNLPIADPSAPIALPRPLECRLYPTYPLHTELCGRGGRRRHVEPLGQLAIRLQEAEPIPPHFDEGGGEGELLVVGGGGAAP